MCLIIAKRRGFELDLDFLKWCMKNGGTYNNDGIGAGFRNTQTNTLEMIKYAPSNDLKPLIKWIEALNVGKDDELMIHQRQGTAGSKTSSNAHPYILGERAYMKDSHGKGVLTIRTNNVKLGLFAHNGIFHNYATTENTLSDSYNYGIQFFGSMAEINLLKSERTKYLETLSGCTHQRLAFMFPDTDMLLWNINICERGLVFSNNGYSSGKYNDRGGQQITVDALDDISEYPSFMDTEDIMYSTGFNIKPNSLFLPANKPESPAIIITSEEEAEIKSIINTSFDYKLEIVETIKPQSETKVYNNKTKDTTSIDVTNCDIPIIVTKDNYKMFIVRNIEKTCLELKAHRGGQTTIPSKNRFEITSIICDQDNEISGFELYDLDDFNTMNTASDWDEYLTYIISLEDFYTNFQILAKDTYKVLLEDYVQLVKKYDKHLSINKTKRLNKLIETILADKYCGVSKSLKDSYPFDKNRYHPEAILMYYNLYLQKGIKSKELV